MPELMRAAHYLAARLRAMQVGQEDFIAGNFVVRESPIECRFTCDWEYCKWNVSQTVGLMLRWRAWEELS